MGRIGGALKKTQGVVGGSALIVCGFLVMWGGAFSQSRTASDLQKLAIQAVDIDPSIPDPLLNGRLVVAAGELTSSEMLEDEYLKPSEALVLKRRVEMFQWMEGESASEGDRGANEASTPSLSEEKRPQPSVSYSMAWSPVQIDFFRFSVPQGHENPLFPIQSKDQVVTSCRFEGFDGAQILKTITQLDALELDASKLKDPTVEIVENRLYIRRTPGTKVPSLGDLRISYEYLPKGEYTILTVQQDERSLIGATPDSRLIVRKGLLSAEDFMEGVKEDSRESLFGMLGIGAALLFVGLVSLLAPNAKSIDLTPRYNLKGARAVLALSAVVSGCVAGAFFLLSFTR